MLRILPVIAVLAAAAPAAAQLSWRPQDTGVTAEIRGMSAASPSVVWAAGRDGTFVRTEDGGASWRTGVVPGAESLFLVDVHAFDASRAVLLGTSFDGGRARIYETTDGGRSWTERHADDRAGVFYDGLAFWDGERGIAFGDPVDGSWVIVRTEDGGRSWTRVPRNRLPTPAEGEAGFAASGTAVAVARGGRAWIGTGGADRARVLYTTDYGASWSAVRTPLPAGPTAGIFGLAFRDARHGIAVGGDFTDPTGASANVARTDDGGHSWTLTGSTVPTGVKYGVAAVRLASGGAAYVATSPSGSGYSLDGGTTWTPMDTVGYNTVAAGGPARSGGAQPVWAAGTDGRVARAVGAFDGVAGVRREPPCAGAAAAELIAADLMFARAVADRGLEAWVEHFAEDGRMFPAGQPVVVGPEAIRAAMAPAFANPDFRLDWLPLDAEAGSGCDLGWTWGRYETGPADAPAEVGKYVTIWRRQPDGSWKVVGDLGTPGAP